MDAATSAQVLASQPGAYAPERETEIYYLLR